MIRDVEGLAEMRAVEELQLEVWGCGEREIVSAMTLIPTVEVGGVLIGAFDAEKLVGFVYGFVGYSGGRVLLHSDMLAVSAGYRDSNLGFALKLAQRRKALARGIQYITWTFDPLQSRNAHLNFSKLGAIADAYKIDFYGEETSSPLHRNVGTDRLWLTWPIRSERVRRRVEGGRAGVEDSAHEEAARLVSVEADGSPRLQMPLPGPAPEHLLIEIPGDIGSYQQKNPPLAAAWRAATRAAFSEALGAGFLVEEFFRPAGERPGAYLLTAGRKVEDFV